MTGSLGRQICCALVNPGLLFNPSRSRALKNIYFRIVIEIFSKSTKRSPLKYKISARGGKNSLFPHIPGNIDQSGRGGTLGRGVHDLSEKKGAATGFKPLGHPKAEKGIHPCQDYLLPLLQHGGKNLPPRVRLRSIDSPCPGSNDMA